MRIVIKIGSNVLTRGDGKLDVTRMSTLVDQIAYLRRKGHEIILVSSGSVAGGRGEMKVSKKLDSVEQRQLFSAIGQVKLVNLYYDLFREYDIHIGQILTMKESFSTRREYLNQRACMEVMIENGVIPVINENDTVSITELMFTDNDELSGLVASMMDADELVILSNVDGIYNGNPNDPESSVIEIVEPGRDLNEYISNEKSSLGRGGMTSKCNIARCVANEGIRVVIANGKRENVLVDLFEHPEETLHTVFLPNPQPAGALKKWIAHSSSFAKGTVTVNHKAAEALRGKHAVSLLMVGVTSVEGDFEEGDLLTILDEDNNIIGIGRSSYDVHTASGMVGVHDVKPLIHYDYMVIY
ncbi:glutamate 5-kinase [uncultured Prevotella sp.]|uniref:glutamate 5-kinase n=1 Tax=uncultured Prevotella sp. TaxID=159272 RepID=UPI00261B5088|nr:glutamate 5-kinase [uncultured Prevotella sp.]